MRALTIIVSFVLNLTFAHAMNDICASEFTPLMQGHAAVMQSASGISKANPKTYEQALAKANSVCGYLTRAQGSFGKIKAWFVKNKDFCQVPEAQIGQVNEAISKIAPQRTAACNAVGNLKAQKTQAEKQAALAQSQGAANPFANNSRPVVNDPFNPQINRKPQLTLDK
jgi:hypothetical protein